MKNRITKYLPFIFIFLLVFGYLGYVVVRLYNETYQVAEDFLISQSSAVNNNFKRWLEERTADLSFISQFIFQSQFSPSKKILFERKDSLILNQVVQKIAYSHNFTNFWLIDDNGNILFSLNKNLNFPEKFLDDIPSRKKIKVSWREMNSPFVEIAVGKRSQSLLFLVYKVNTEYFGSGCYLVGSFDFDLIVKHLITLFFSRFDIVQYTFAYPLKDSVLVI
ncbi:MAG: hypothetical protein ACPLPX_07980 [Candidatus Kapaibacteriota bacterium]